MDPIYWQVAVVGLMAIAPGMAAWRERRANRPRVEGAIRAVKDARRTFDVSLKDTGWTLRGEDGSAPMHESQVSRMLEAGYNLAAFVLEAWERPAYGVALWHRIGDLLPTTTESVAEERERLLRRLEQLPRREQAKATCQTVRERDSSAA